MRPLRRKSSWGTESPAFRTPVGLAFLGAAAAPVLLIGVPKADAHAALSDWIYPIECCSDRDCQPVHSPDITEGPNGYVVGNTGEIIGYKDRRLRNSPDGEYHLCEIPGQAPPHAICLFVPPRGS